MSSLNAPSTIFLTPEEDQRIRNTFKANLQNLESLSNQPRVPRSSSYWQNQIARASFLSDFPPSIRSNTITTYPIGHSYAPCLLPPSSLTSISLTFLLMNTHHRGRVLLVKRVAPMVHLVASSWTIVSDEEGEIERLEMGMCASQHGLDTWEDGSALQIKEPYYTLSDQGELTLRVDHPSDLVIRDETSQADGSASQETGNCKDDFSVKSPQLTATQYKESGNAALAQRNLPLAYHKYTQGLRLLLSSDPTSNNELKSDLHRNRSLIALLLSHFDEAKSDALASLTGLDDERHRELDAKACSRAGQAAYHLRHFHEAKVFFKKQLLLTPHDAEAALRLKKVVLRLQEQDAGKYNLFKLEASVSTTPRIDAANYTSNVCTRPSPGRGRGLFATRDIEAGKMVMCEKAFGVVWGYEKEALTAMTYDRRDDMIRVFPAGLWRTVVQKFLQNPSQTEKVLDLYSDYRPSKSLVPAEDMRAVIDVFQIHDIIAHNAFGPGPLPSRSQSINNESSNASTGLWILAAYMNHSCVPNAEKSFIGDLMIVRASQDIKAGEEITHSYDASSDFEERRKTLMTTWGFECGCGSCVAEEADGKDMRERRARLEREAQAFVQREGNMMGGVKRVAVAKARRLEKEIRETYDEVRWEGVPRTALARIQTWLAQSSKS